MSSERGPLMATVSGPEDAEPGRAELYLRLQVEAELRRGLGMPRYEPPRQRVFPDRILGALGTLQRRRRAAAMTSRLRQARSGGRAAARPGRFRVVTATDGPTHAGAAGRRMTAAVRRVLERPVARLETWRFAWRHWFRLHMWRLTSRWRRRGKATEPTSVDLGLERVTSLAAALTTIGAIGEATQTQVLDDFQTALAARGMTDPHMMLGRMPWRPRGRPVKPYTSGPLRAIPFGVITDFELDGRQGRIYLGALVTDAGSATLNFRARLQEPAEESPVTLAQLRAAASGRSHHLVMTGLDNIEATDNLGGSYSAHFSGGGGGDEEWQGRFHFHPVPPAAARWLDLSLPGPAAPVRVPLDAPSAALPVTSRYLDLVDAADRYLDMCTVEQLQLARPGDEEAGDWPGLFGLAAELRGAGVLTARSPSLARLAAAAESFGVRRPHPLADISPGVLPAEWLGQLARSGAADGPAGHITVATALPVVDGAHCVVTDLESEPASMSLHIHARGWPDPHRYGTGRADLFHWTARDDVGGWYTMSESGWSHSDGVADMDMVLYPALNPRAQELQIILTGRTAEASVTVPLIWRPLPLSREPLNREPLNREPLNREPL